MARGYSVENDYLVIKRKLTPLDLFVKEFLNILKKHSDYLIVSGYVSISTGRSRGTEDVDILIPKLKKEQFFILFENLKDEGFWCYQGEDPKEAYVYIENLNSIRFAKKNNLFPNIEMIPFDSSKKAKTFEFQHPQKIRIDGFEFKIPEIEFEIAYKEEVLKGKKDIDDAKHLRAFFINIISDKKINKYKIIAKTELK